MYPSSLLLELLLLALAELPLETGVLLGGLGHATHLVNAAQQEAALSAITITNGIMSHPCQKETGKCAAKGPNIMSPEGLQDAAKGP